MKKRRKYKKKRIIILLFIIILIIVGIILFSIFNKDIKVELNKKLEVEINTEAKLLSFIKKVDNGKIDTKDKLIDTSKLGEQELVINLSNNIKKKEYKFKIKVVDTTKPEIDAKEKVSTVEGTKIDLLKDVKVKDNSKEEIKVEVIGDYDFNKKGEYKLKYIAKDSSKNEAIKDFKLIVEEKPKEKVETNNSGNSSFTTSKGYSGKVVNGITYINGVLIANKTYSLPSSYYPGGLTNETQNAFNKLKEAATSLGYNFFVGSGFRSYATQKTLYNNYVASDGQANADTYSARAGHSEHQTGLAFDVCDHNVSACVTSAFDTTDQAKWINDNCYKYGLIVRYPKGKTNETGYMYESWHLRYVGVDLATKLYNNGSWITLEDYFGIDSKYK